MKIYNVCNRHIHAFGFKLYKNEYLRYAFRATASTAVKDKLYL